MKVIDKQFTECSAMGVQQMVDFLNELDGSASDLSDEESQ